MKTVGVCVCAIGAIALLVIGAVDASLHHKTAAYICATAGGAPILVTGLWKIVNNTFKDR